MAPQPQTASTLKETAQPPRPVRVPVLGVNVSRLTLDELLSVIDSTAGSGGRARLLYVNAHAANLAYTTPWLRRYFNAAEYVLCDGFGVKWGARLLGRPLPARFTPPDWLPKVADMAARRGYSLYFLGNRPGVAEAAAARLVAQFPGLSVAGTHHGYFDKRPGSAENEAVVAALAAARPNILYVGFGIPAQERWLMENWDRLPVNVAITAGAMLDFVAGATPRGPRWMTDRGLEWLSRLIVEPQRLWRRYLVGNPLFLLRILRERIAGPQHPADH